MSNDRKALIRLASTLEKGSEERRAILAGLQKQSDYFPPGTPLQGKIECCAKYLNSTSLEPNLDFRWWEKAGIDTCPVCGSTDTDIDDEIRFGPYRGKARSECSNCGSSWLWEAKARWVDADCGDFWIGDGKRFKGKPARGSILHNHLPGVTPEHCK